MCEFLELIERSRDALETSWPPIARSKLVGYYLQKKNKDFPFIDGDPTQEIIYPANEMPIKCPIPKVMAAAIKPKTT